MMYKSFKKCLFQVYITLMIVIKFLNVVILQLWFLLWSFSASYCSKSYPREQVIIRKPAFGFKDVEFQSICKYYCLFSFYFCFYAEFLLHIVSVFNASDIHGYANCNLMNPISHCGSHLFQ